MATYERWRMVKYYEGETGFLYYPRDNMGNYIYDGNGNIQVNMLVTNKNGFVKIKERVGYQDGDNFVGYDSNLSYWTNNKEYIVSNIVKGRPPAIPFSASYYFLKGGYSIAIKYTGSAIEFHVLDKAHTVYWQIFTAVASGVNGIVHLQAKKDGSEILLHIQQTAKTPPFDITNFVELNQYVNELNRAKLKWEKIIKFSVEETNNIESPFVFTEISNIEQWRAVSFVFDVTDNTTKSAVQTTPPDGFHIYGVYTINSVYSYEVSLHTEASGNNIVLNCFYDNNDNYVEDVFSFTDLTKTSTRTLAYSGFLHDPYNVPVDVVTGSSYSQTELLFDFNFSINSIDCGLNYQISPSELVSSGLYYMPSSRPFFCVLEFLNNNGIELNNNFSGSTTKTFNYINIEKLYYYSKINPVIAASDSVSPTITENSGFLNFNLTGFNGSIQCSDTAIFYSDTEPLVSASPGDWMQIKYTKQAILIYDLNQFKNLQSTKKIITDKFNNHLTVYDETPFNGGSAIKIKLINSALSTAVDITGLLNTTYYDDDFFGAI